MIRPAYNSSAGDKNIHCVVSAELKIIVSHLAYFKSQPDELQNGLEALNQSETHTYMFYIFYYNKYLVTRCQVFDNTKMVII